MGAPSCPFGDSHPLSGQSSKTSGTVLAQSAGFLLPRSGDFPTLYQSLRLALHQAAQRVSCSDRVTPHRLRHYSGDSSLASQVDINTIRRWLGHVSLETTNIYAETDMAMKARALAMCEVKQVKRLKPWRDDPDLLAFLQKL
ncbi:MAG: hypothetical protein DMG57_35225 [Acidobacteria bacterium]|nr:MAG: hypothetical protein DMG57_35225 [Acidobacteriota bacterium]